MQTEYNLLLAEKGQEEISQKLVSTSFEAVVETDLYQYKKDFDLGLVGKGVTFDSGGISIKPSQGMGDMKQDMAGSAVVVSSLKALAGQKAKLNVVGIVRDITEQVK